MIEKGRISAGQMALILYASIIATGSSTLPSMAGQYAGRDLWLTPVWATVSGFSAFFVSVLLNRYYPRDTIIQYSRKILGTVLGTAVGFLYFATYTHANSFVIREYAELVKMIFLRDTPMVVLMGGIALVCAAAVRGGLESYARSVQFLIPPAFFVLLVTLIFTVKDWHPENMLPIFEDGIVPSLKGAIVPMIWFSDFFLVSYLLPHLADREKAVPWGVAAIIGAMATLVVINLVSLYVFGTETVLYTFPYLEVFRYISVAQFIERIDSFLLAIWVILTFVKISLFHYTIVLSAAQWLGLSDYRFLSLPWAVILVAFGIWTSPSFPFYIHFFSTKVIFYSHLMQIVIPSLLLAIAWIRNRHRSENGRKLR